MQCVISSLFRPITKLMWILVCNETNLQAYTQWKGKGIRETLLINGFKLKTTKSSSCRPAVCFNDCGMGPDVCLSSFSLSNVLGKFIVNYRGLLLGYISLGRAIPRHQPLKHIVAWQQVNQCRDDLQIPDGPHVGPMNLAIRGLFQIFLNEKYDFNEICFLGSN